MFSLSKDLQALARTDDYIVATQLQIAGQVARIKRLNALDSVDTPHAEELLRTLRDTLFLLRRHRSVIANAVEVVEEAGLAT